MYNENKVKQVINAVKENHLSAMDDEGLARLLSILSPKEYDVFELLSFQELGGINAMMRVSRVRPLVRLMIDRDLYRIKNSDFYAYYLASLANGRYIEFFSTLKTEELADLKKYIYFNVDENNKVQKSGADKIIRIITSEIAKRDTIKKPRLQNLVS
ncbi:MAG: hypothetical protein OSJ70_07460 [Bacilli bacterium]|nr:hypothetical protein [Bacilli bacterium]